MSQGLSADAEWTHGFLHGSDHSFGNEVASLAAQASLIFPDIVSAVAVASAGNLAVFEQ